jgi:hypothetical protein
MAEVACARTHALRTHALRTHALRTHARAHTHAHAHTRTRTRRPKVEFYAKLRQMPTVRTPHSPAAPRLRCAAVARPYSAKSGHPISITVRSSATSDGLADAPVQGADLDETVLRHGRMRSMVAIDDLYRPPPHLRLDSAHPMSHLHRDWGSHPPTSAPGLGLPCHICAWTGAHPCHICTEGWGSPLPHLHRGAGLTPCS